MDASIIAELRQLKAQVEAEEKASQAAQDRFIGSRSIYSNPPRGRDVFDERAKQARKRYAEACADRMADVLDEVERLQAVEAEFQKHLPFLMVHGLLGPTDLNDLIPPE